MIQGDNDMYYSKKIMQSNEAIDHIKETVDKHYYFEPIKIIYSSQGVTIANAPSKDQTRIIMAIVDDHNVTIEISQMVPNPDLFDGKRMMVSFDKFDRSDFVGYDVSQIIDVLQKRLSYEAILLHDRFIKSYNTQGE